MDVLSYPFPCKAWMALANDPDNTLISDWNELHRFIWEELGLPFGDSLFVASYNQNLPGQVNLKDHPQIASAHRHDIIHTWGDHMHSGKRGFDRDDASDAAALLKEHGLRPLVWIDHASFVGNMLHGTYKGAVPAVTDSSGHVYRNFVYSLDLAREAGVRYIWNGEVNAVIGQDRKLNFGDYLRMYNGKIIKAVLRTMFSEMPVSTHFWPVPDNRAYYRHKFQDGSELYCFRRFGTWKDADIQGLAKVISPHNIEKLIQSGGTSIVYTHLGKRQADHMQDERHIPDNTREALTHVAQRYKDGDLILSSVSELLDYLVIRDSLQIIGSSVNFLSDGIRYSTLSKEDLKGKSFSFRRGSSSKNGFQILIDGRPVQAEVTEHSKHVFTISFN